MQCTSAYIAHHHCCIVTIIIIFVCPKLANLTKMPLRICLELVKRCESKLMRCDQHVNVKTRGKNGKVIQWPWKITCGICKRNIQMRYNSDLKGRISYFDRRKSEFTERLRYVELSEKRSRQRKYFHL